MLIGRLYNGVAKLLLLQERCNHDSRTILDKNFDKIVNIYIYDYIETKQYIDKQLKD